MSSRLRDSGLVGVALVAITYVYFLIFAQFAFLTRLAEWGVGDVSLKIVMAAMAIGGVALSLLCPRTTFVSSPTIRLRIALALCALAALSSLLTLSLVEAAITAFVIGAGLGILTVTLVTHLPSWIGQRNIFLKIATGTGIGYFLCNVPALFAASATTQAIVAAFLCVGAAVLTLVLSDESVDVERPQYQGNSLSFPLTLLAFSALVWLDSAAFYIIQHSPALKAGTWMGTAHLWTNGCIHFAAAILAGILLRRGRLSLVFALAVGALGSACILLHHPAVILSASAFYPAGVSLYSVALVAYPSSLSPAMTAGERARQAGWLYAIAGWIGSALGIGMGQNLGQVPYAFIAAAGAAVLLPASFGVFGLRWREIALVTAGLAAALGLLHFLPPERIPTASSPVERGRQLYISEGCINCHSQYVRPNSPDVLMWGPVESVEALHDQRPPLIGNRRQGPDLSQVGTRRSSLWLKAHLIDPAEVSGGSIMPSYAFLFRDERGDDMVGYLASLRGPDAQQEVAIQASWHPSDRATRDASAAEGGRLYVRLCATCHSANGATRKKWASAFSKVPTDLQAGPFTYAHLSEPDSERIDRLAQITKFGIRGTDMPGHEYLSDEQVASVALWIEQQSKHSIHNP